MPGELLPNELQFIEEAAAYLESPSLLIRLADLLGKPLAVAVQSAEKFAPAFVENAVNSALRAAMNVAIWTMPDGSPSAGPAPESNLRDVGSSPDFWHKLSVGVTGTAGGFFGLPGAAVELPITTTIMLRSILAIAKEFGEDVADANVRFQCLSVFSLGGPGKEDDDLESTYLSARVALDALIGRASKFVVGKTAEEVAAALQKGAAPQLVSLITKIAARFNVSVTEKLVAQALPILGAVGGATINVAFMDHFNRVARYHFGIRALERKYDPAFVQAAYQAAARRAKG